MPTYWSHQIRRNLRTLCLCLSVFPALAIAAGTGYNTTYVNGVKTITLPEETATFTPGPDVDLVIESCTECHSADYPTTQASQTRSEWLAVIEKMQNNFDMPVLSNTDQSLVLDYLTSYYGN